MKHVWLILLVLALSAHLNAQYYLRGEVKDEKGKLLPNVRINLFSKGNYPFYTGSSGTFGIPSSSFVDTITLNLDGYETIKKPVETQRFQSLILKTLNASPSANKNKLSSITKNLLKEQNSFFSAQGESYSNLIENTFIETKKYPETGFALNIDRASYSNIRRFLNNEIFVPTDAVRIEEMLNYFDFKCTRPNTQKDKFNHNTYITSCPWNADNQLLFVNLCAPKLNLDSVPSSNLVFLIDISGSMDKPNRLPLLQSAFKMLADNLREKDTVSIVVYGGGVYVPLPPTSGANKEAIRSVIDSLTAAGDTPGEGAIRTAYSIAKQAYIKNGNNRVILATDGDFNVGQTSEKQLDEMITEHRQSGIYLTCLGVGMGNYKDSKLETLAKKGNGNFAYIDNIHEAEKVLITEFTKTMYAVANDAYLNISFNSTLVKQYRLIGFDNRRSSVEDSTSELEGGEVGSGHSLMAIFEITPRSQANSDTIDISLGKATLQYKLPGTVVTQSQSFPIPYVPQFLSTAPAPLRFAASVAMFGSLLKRSAFATGITFTDVLTLAQGAITPGDFQQQEFISLVQKADKLYNPKKRKKKKGEEE